MGFLKIAVAILAVAGLAFAVLTVWGHWRWQGLTQGLVEQLDAARLEPRPALFDARELDGLPPVVQRYFRAVLPEASPIIAAAEIEHSGRFNMGETADAWKPFSSRQRVVMQKPGFVWDGAIRMLPGLSVRVHDAYVAGEGVLHPAILGLFTLASLRGTGTLAQGELMRFYAEAVCYPTALLPSQGVRWTPVSESSALATVDDGGVAVSLTFTFGADGLIESVRAEARGRTVGGQIVMRPWEGRWFDYRVQAGMRVPMAGEVAWLLPPEEGGRKPYWRGSTTLLRYEFAPKWP